MTTIRIPGKVMLSGEYAVLHGGTAVLVPISRCVAFTETDRPPDRPYPAMATAALTFPIPELQDFEASHGRPHVSIDASEFFAAGEKGERVKLGLGMSAAEAAGVVALRFERAGISWVEQQPAVARHAMAVHRRVQGGAGSGADVAACVYQAPIRFRLEGDTCRIDPAAPGESGPTLPMALVWSGSAADTRELVAGFEAWAGSGDPAAGRLVRDLVDSSHRLAEAWFTAPPDQLLERLDAFTDMMNRCADGAGIPYRLPVHERLSEWAAGYGGRAKPTGAGGGDMVLVVGDVPLDRLDGLKIPL